MKSRHSIRILSFAVMTYMLLALGWWSILLLRKNEEVYNLHIRNATETQLEDLKDYRSRQNNMIIGEAVVFGIMLITGIWLINRFSRKSMEAAVQQNNFLLAVTHELKTPISSIQLALDTLKNDKLSFEEKKEMVEIAEEENNRLNGLVNNLLFTSRLDHRYDLIRRQVDISQLITLIVDGQKRKHKEREIELHADEPKTIMHLDDEAIKMLLLNLIDNALKYSPETKPINIDLYRDTNQMMLIVSDQGVGISSGEKTKIFNKFYRVGNEETRSSSGTGLGLYIAHEIAKQHGGSLGLIDNKPTGCKFIVSLPIE